MNICLLIPIYNHGKTIDDLLTKLSQFNLACVLVDDGSNAQTKGLIDKAKKKHPWVIELVTLINNSGKGGAIIAGMQKAQSLGYTHVIQIDADGQHDVNDISRFLFLHKQHPNAFISGTPKYDASAPKSRKYGRKITNFWVSIETLSLKPKDAMCGYRIYPISETLNITQKYNIGKRMDFDIEIMVRLIWQGIEIITLPTKVIYPKDGVSNFKMIKDNLLISWMHTRLVFGMIPRVPKIIIQKFKKNKPKAEEPHWSKMAESGTMFGLKFMLLVYKILGKRLAYLMLYPLISYYYLTRFRARRASKQYLAKIDNNKYKSNFKHLMTFAQSMIDKLDVWNGKISIEHINFPNRELLLKQAKQKSGGVILTAHLGNIEIARALSQKYPNIKFNALVFNSHAVNFNSLLKKLNPNFSLDLIGTQSLNASKAIELKDKVEAGEFVVIAADRTSTSKAQRYISAKFLDQDASFPEGPFILSGILKCPVYFMLCLKENKSQYHMVFDKVADQYNISRSNRQKNLEKYAQQYADILSGYCVQYPLQWFNFFNFWQKPEQEIE